MAVTASDEAKNASIWLLVDLSQPHASSLAAQAMSALVSTICARVTNQDDGLHLHAV